MLRSNHPDYAWTGSGGRNVGRGASPDDQEPRTRPLYRVLGPPLTRFPPAAYPSACQRRHRHETQLRPTSSPRSLSPSRHGAPNGLHPRFVAVRRTYTCNCDWWGLTHLYVPRDRCLSARYGLARRSRVLRPVRQRTERRLSTGGASAVIFVIGRVGSTGRWKMRVARVRGGHVERDDIGTVLLLECCDQAANQSLGHG